MVVLAVFYHVILTLQERSSKTGAMHRETMTDTIIGKSITVTVVSLCPRASRKERGVTRADDSNDFVCPEQLPDREETDGGGTSVDRGC